MSGFVGETENIPPGWTEGGPYLNKSGVQYLWDKIKSGLVPSISENGKVLISQNGKAVWGDAGGSGSLDSALAYGIEWTSNSSNPKCTRIGNLSLHKSLPIQSGMRGCVYDSINKAVVYWLNPDDWRWKQTPDEIVKVTITGGPGDGEEIIDPEDPPLREVAPIRGTYKIVPDNTTYRTANFLSRLQGGWIKIPDKSGELIDCEVYSINLSTYTIEVVTSDDLPIAGGVNMYVGSCLNGTDGDVMVYVPEFYIKTESTGTKNRVLISQYSLGEDWERSPECFVSAYRNVEKRSNTGLIDGYLYLGPNGLYSVVSEASGVKGGQRTSVASSTGIWARLETKCRTGLTRDVFRTLARATGKELMTYRQWKRILYWLPVIEYATFDLQQDFNPALSSGYRQGGLSIGLSEFTNWSSVSNGNPIIPNGYTNTAGNNSIAVEIYPYDFNTPAYATRYRGIENPFGHISYFLDGALCYWSSSTSVRIGTTSDPALFTYTNNTFFQGAGSVTLSVPSATKYNGFVKEWDFNKKIEGFAELIPSLTDSSITDSTYKCLWHKLMYDNVKYQCPVVWGVTDSYPQSIKWENYNITSSKIGAMTVVVP